jgi:transposase
MSEHVIHFLCGPATSPRAAPTRTASWRLPSGSGASGRTQGPASALNQLLPWPPLARFHGRVEIDSKAAEPAIRAVALGRKNILFAGSDAVGERAAAMYSLLGSAKLNGVDPEGYLRYVLERIAEHPENRGEELLPWNVNLARTADAE